jgi:hypothetical protein
MECTLDLSYDRQTVNSPNPLARFAHRNRMKKSVQLALSKLGDGPLLDYGCGSGFFISEILKVHPGGAVGYEPYMTERAGVALPIYDDINAARSKGPFSLVTLFETIEHLSEAETVGFLDTCTEVLAEHGGILVSGPIEIGPALIAKEVNRSVLRFKKPEHWMVEFAKASILGIPARRAEDIKSSHRGFDFRAAIALFKALGWSVEVLNYGPLPIGTWYGNSQFYLYLAR